MRKVLCRLANGPEELERCFDIRRRVFVHEQKLFEDSDQDEHDNAALHLAAFIDDRIIGTVRVYQEPDGAWWGGRLAVLKSYRGRAGRKLVKLAVELVKQRSARHFYANIQKENLSFFINIGWRPRGEEFKMQGRQHILIEADL